MSFDKFIQSRTIAVRGTVGSSTRFPIFTLDSFIEFENDGYLIGAHFMTAHVSDGLAAGAILINRPFGFMLAKSTGQILSVPAGGNVTAFSGAQILVTHLDYASNDGAASLNSADRQTTIGYDADTKRIPLKSNDRLGVYICSNASAVSQNYSYTLTAYFVSAVS